MRTLQKLTQGAKRNGSVHAKSQLYLAAGVVAAAAGVLAGAALAGASAAAGVDVAACTAECQPVNDS